MSEQQYRVVADRTSMADDSWITEGDRVTYGSVSSTGELVIFRIERPVPTTDVGYLPFDERREFPVRPPSPRLPTREQIVTIADAEIEEWMPHASLHERSIANVWFRAGADAAIALIQNGADQ